MQKIEKYFFSHWIKLFFLTIGIVFMLIYLVFFAMLFLQVMDHEGINIVIVLKWVLLRTMLIMQTMTPLLFLFSIIFMVFYFEHKNELKAIYLCGKNLFTVTKFLWIMAGLIVILQVVFSQNLIPRMQSKNRDLENLYLSDNQNGFNRMAMMNNRYIIEFLGFNPDRLELNNIQIINTNIRNSSESSPSWIWLEASRAIWKDDHWQLSRVRAVDADTHWHQASTLNLSDIIPSVQELWQHTMHQLWPYMQSRELKQLVAMESLTVREKDQVRYLLAKRFIGWLTLLILLYPLRWYDPAKKWSLLRLLLVFIITFIVGQVMNFWSETWLKHTGVTWYIAIVIPGFALILFLSILWFVEGKHPKTKIHTED